MLHSVQIVGMGVELIAGRSGRVTRIRIYTARGSRTIAAPRNLAAFRELQRRSLLLGGWTGEIALGHGRSVSANLSGAWLYA
jgi:uncharacterized protein YjhX (UPF0386 family)